MGAGDKKSSDVGLGQLEVFQVFKWLLDSDAKATLAMWAKQVLANNAAKSSATSSALASNAVAPQAQTKRVKAESAALDRKAQLMNVF